MENRSLARIGRPSQWMVAILAAVAVAHQSVGLFHRELIYNAAGVGAVLAILVGLHLHRRPHKAGWLWIAGGTLCFALGDIIYFHHEELLGGPAPYPGVADYLYVVAYPLVVAGMASFIKQRRGGLAPALDAAMLAVTAGVLVWVFVIDIAADQNNLSFGARVVSLSSPVGGVLVIAMIAWLALVSRGRRGPFPWLILAYLLNFIASVIYARQAIEGTYSAGGWLDLGWILSYVCVGAAGLMAPATGHLSSGSQLREAGELRRRLALLAATGLLGPLLIAIARVRGTHVDTTEVAVGCLILFLLALCRMAMLATALNRHTRLLDERGAELAQTIARLTEAEADRKRLLEAVMTAGESERAALARELHDGPIQHLSTLNFETDLTLMSLADGDVSAATSGVQSIQDGLTLEIDGLRDLMSLLRPPALDEHGLIDALRDHVDDFSRRTGINAVYSAALGTRLDPATETVLYRAVQESLINVQKHAQAKNVQIDLAADEDSVTLSVADDGVGFDTGDSHVFYKPGHLGLVAMRERVEIAGGKFKLLAELGQGTTIQVVLPLSMKEELYV